jgi:energy-coupling factor transporter ATP-binding protein EcfA2
LKTLKKLKLIKWHYFENETIEFDHINFLTGSTGSGKSTIIDALQLLLLGDTNGNYFNKSANEKSDRDLKGYLRGDAGEEEIDNSGETKEHRTRYIRNGQFTSYIACEFSDSVKKDSKGNNGAFTLGVVFDCYEDGTHDHKFFWLGNSIPENGFIENSTPMPFTNLKDYFAKTYSKDRYRFYSVNKEYQEDVLGKLGALNRNYFGLLKKTIPFAPLKSIEEFITEYVCDIENNVDIAPMQENIRQYQQLKQEADSMANRVAELEEISKRYSDWSVQKLRLDVHNYVIERSQQQIALDNLTLYKEELVTNQEKINTLSSEQKKCKERIVSLREESGQLTTIKNTSEPQIAINALTGEINLLVERINKIEGSIEILIGNMRKYGYIWRERMALLASARDEDGASGENLLKADTINDWNSLLKHGVDVAEHADGLLNADIGSLARMGESGYSSIRQDVASLVDVASRIRLNFSQSLKDVRLRLSDNHIQMKNLKVGIKPYDSKLLELKGAITDYLSKKYGREIGVHILADLLDIKDTRWTKAIEGYLNTQKFYLIVEPDYFLDALSVYNKLRFERGFYNWGVVDTGKLVAKKPSRQTGSLAEDVLTDNQYARLFIDFNMGRLIKCDQERDLRNYERSITDTCMLYQSYVVRQMHPDLWKSPFIGASSVDEQIKLKDREIAQLTENEKFYDGRLKLLQNITSMNTINDNEERGSLDTIKQSSLLPGLKEEHSLATDKLGAIDITWISELAGKIRDMEAEITRLDKSHEDLIGNIRDLQNSSKNIAERDIPEEQEKANAKQTKINELFDASWIAENGEPRFIKEVELKKSAQEIESRFSSRIANAKNQEENKWASLKEARMEYRIHLMSHDVDSPDNDAYEKELAELRDINLPGYKDKIAHAEENAQIQFKEDFLAKLKSNIDTAIRQINELNDALKSFAFGADSYRFTVNQRQEHQLRQFYNMIMDDMTLKGYTLFSAPFQDKHGATMRELFQLIADIDGAATADIRARSEESIAKYTDYRTYLKFDLVVSDKDDAKSVQRLSSTLNKKSGGETQTPFYIAVLASFAQTYRIGIKGEPGNTIRLIIFDEAFSKMDSIHIQESISLLRQFGFQAIMAAPSEKAGEIMNKANRTICAFRKGHRSWTKRWDIGDRKEDLSIEL